MLTDLDAHWNGRNADKMSLLFTEDVDFRIYDRTQYKNRGEFSPALCEGVRQDERWPSACDDDDLISADHR